MNNPKRVVIAVLAAASLLFFGLSFWPFIMNDIIQPIALVVWLLLRMFVLSIDQSYFWGAIIFAVVFFMVRLLPRDQAGTQTDEFPDSNESLNNIAYWRTLFSVSSDGLRDDTTLKRELIHLLSGMYASKQRTANSFEIYTALQSGEIPLPENIHVFLFQEDAAEAKQPFKKFIQTIRKTPRKWIRRWTGQETADHYRLITEVLCFMETSLEIKNDNGNFNPN